MRFALVRNLEARTTFGGSTPEEPRRSVRDCAGWATSAPQMPSMAASVGGGAGDLWHTGCGPAQPKKKERERWDCSCFVVGCSGCGCGSAAGCGSCPAPRPRVKKERERSYCAGGGATRGVPDHPICGLQTAVESRVTLRSRLSRDLNTVRLLSAAYVVRVQITASL